MVMTAANVLDDTQVIPTLVTSAFCNHQVTEGAERGMRQISEFLKSNESLARRLQGKIPNYRERQHALEGAFMFLAIKGPLGYENRWIMLSPAIDIVWEAAIEVLNEGHSGGYDGFMIEACGHAVPHIEGSTPSRQVATRAFSLQQVLIEKHFGPQAFAQAMYELGRIDPCFAPETNFAH